MANGYEMRLHNWTLLPSIICAHNSERNVNFADYRTWFIFPYIFLKLLFMNGQMFRKPQAFIGHI